jgi:protein-S-isoprenylcysteine O-methyltransferase Ste14
MPDMSGVTRTLARHRVRLGFVTAVCAFWFAEPTPRSLAAGAIVAAAGEALRIWAAGHLEKGREVTVSGPYRLTRHPLYVGSFIMAMGFAIASANLISALLTLGYLGATIGAAIRSEETHLTEKFGSAYPDYREGRTPAIERRFSLARVKRNREHRALCGFVAALALLAWKAL